MKEIGIRALRNALSAWVRRVERGERVAVTDHGRVVALLTPAPRTDDPEATIRRLVSEGVIRPATESGPMFAGMKTMRLPKGSAIKLINEDRDEP
jgi:prevent-host-death family protein